MSQFVSGDENSSAVAAAQQAQAERVELDEARRVALVIGARIVLEGHDLLAVERIRRLAADDMDAALVELQADGARHLLLAMVDGSLEHLALRREPEAVIDEFGIARRQLVLQMRRAPVERQLFDPAMGEVIDGRSEEHTSELQSLM